MTAISKGNKTLIQSPNWGMSSSIQTTPERSANRINRSTTMKITTTIKSACVRFSRLVNLRRPLELTTYTNPNIRVSVDSWTNLHLN